MKPASLEKTRCRGKAVRTVGRGNGPDQLLPVRRIWMPRLRATVITPQKIWLIQLAVAGGTGAEKEGTSAVNRHATSEARAGGLGGGRGKEWKEVKTF